jgi:exo-1,4-beta-D-glucosaminidase
LEEEALMESHGLRNPGFRPFLPFLFWLQAMMLISLSPSFLSGSQLPRIQRTERPAEFGETVIALTDWFLQSSERLHQGGETLSLPGVPVESWYPASVPSTVLGTLVENNVFRQVFFARNFEKIPADAFSVPWWYRTEFLLSGLPWQRTAILELDGLNYRANVWLNGQKIGDASQIYGPFRRFEIDISSVARFGEKNVLAIEVIPPAKGEPAIGFVDWNPAPPDKSMGLWRGARIRLSGAVAIKNVFIQTDLDTSTLKEARLTLLAELKNNTDRPVSGRLEAEIETIKVSQEVKLEPQETKKILFSPDNFSQLVIKNPRIWWTHDLGTPELYFLILSFKMPAPPREKPEIKKENNPKEIKVQPEANEASRPETGQKRLPFAQTPEIASDWRVIRFGIRKVEAYFNEAGYRGFRLNGRPVLIRGGGWVDDIFLNVKPKKLIKEILYARHLNLNALRLEGFWGTGQAFYDLCDENGLLLLAGWSCQWEWENLLGKPTDRQYGGIISPEDMALITQSFRDQVRWLRNHPSILVWLLASDLQPRPELEQEYLRILKEEDPTRPFLISAANRTSSLSGPSGVKMNGPYDWVPPNYWYEDKKRGGAFGFNTEAGPGPQIPQLETLKKIFPETSLWPPDEIWNFHCSRGRFANLNRYLEAMTNRLGEPRNLDEFLRKAHYLDYEAMRAPFEAFVANRYLATGHIQWMYNSAWPKLWWQLYDYYLLPTAGFYGAKKACSPLHLIYNYETREIIASNLTSRASGKKRALIRVFNFDLSEKFKTELPFNLGPDSQIVLTRLPEIEGLSKVYFLDLRILDPQGELIDHNFYCLAPRMDILDEDQASWFVTPVRQYADLTLLNSLGKAEIKFKSKTAIKEDRTFFSLELENVSSNLAFLVEISVRQKLRQKAVAPIFLEDNYFSLLPKEKRIITGYFFTEDLEGDEPEITISGWNIK